MYFPVGHRILDKTNEFTFGNLFRVGLVEAETATGDTAQAIINHRRLLDHHDRGRRQSRRHAET